ncbi:MAG: glycosyltransferase family 39 protein [Nitrososphaerota archaeon]|nr:glycosyltransferase family 39 protein [Nitrososphaerota archaeon]
MAFQEPSEEPVSRLLLGLFAGSSAAILLLLVLVIIVHALTSAPSLVPVVGVLSVTLAGFAVISIADGICFAWSRYPAHRKAVTFVVAVTLATLLAHAYVMGTPGVSTPGSASGAVGTHFGNSEVSVNSSRVGAQLVVSVQAEAGGSAIANLSILSGGAPLAGGGFVQPPSYSSPLEPGNTATGMWTLGPGETVANVTVDYRSLTCYDSTDQVYGCIMDEVFYVPAAQHMLAGAQCQQGVPRNDPAYCNPEHPPLTKALVAAGMAVFGEYNTVGWRVMPALLGSFSIPLVFGIAWKVSESKKIAALSALLLALDVLFFSQSSAALLDIPPLFFELAAFFVVVAGVKWWKFDRYFFAGVLMGLAGLAKETAIFPLMGLLTYILLFGDGIRLRRVYSVLKVALVVIVVFSVGLQAYDSALASQSYQLFSQQIAYLLSYGASLTGGCPWSCGWTNTVTGGYITPFNWVTYYSPIGYYLVSVTVNPGNLHYVSVGYYGVTNLLETWTIYVWVPLAAYALYRHRRKEKQPSLDQFTAAEGAAPPAAEAPLAAQGTPADLKFAGLALTMFAWTFLPYIALFFAGRVTYPFYIIDAVPFMAMGTAYWLSRKWFPKWLVWVYLAFVFVFFLVYFPDKAFLPVGLRVLLGH